jgi:acetylornithine deacetylase/succinyl-diaminopimelate desuccinylase-like protein
MKNHLKNSLEYAHANFESYVEALGEIVAIPSISHEGYDKQDIQRAVVWLEKRLNSLSMDRVRIFHTKSNPILFAEKETKGEGKPTVLIYAHYDVQPAEPIDAWQTNPFEATLKGEYLYGRGTSDMKGQFMACVAALESILAGGELPVNVKFLIEGDEETDPEPIETFIREHGDLLQSDHCLNVDAGMLRKDLPTIVYGLRGAMSLTLEITGPDHDLHDGMYGGVVENPIHVLTHLIAGLQDANRRITLPGFYDRVRKIEPDEHSAAMKHPSDGDYYLHASGAPALIPDDEFLPIERIGARPSFNVRWIETGAKKSAIPARARARLAFRLVPEQDPKEVFKSLKEYVSEEAPGTVIWSFERLVSSPGVLVPAQSEAINMLETALQETWGAQPLLQRIGGAIPVVGELQDKLGIDSLLTGFSLPDDNIHGPNERLHLPTLKRGIEALIRYFFLIGTIR